MSTEAMPGRTIGWGVVIAVAGAVLILVAPTVLSAVLTPNTEQWASAYYALDLVLGVTRVLLPPLGAALIAAGLVMKYLDRRLQGDGIADRPRRWRWPADAER